MRVKRRVHPLQDEKKCAPIRALDTSTNKDQLEIVSLELQSPHEVWLKFEFAFLFQFYALSHCSAFRGASYVLHIASPVLLKGVKESERIPKVVQPAIDGTLNCCTILPISTLQFSSAKSVLFNSGYRLCRV